MKTKIITAFCACFLTLVMNAQETNTKATKTVKHKHTAVSKKGTKMPEWAAAHNYDATNHVYFPDYYTFYDPTREGYVFYDKGKWSVTPTVPPYMSNVDLSKSRVQILKGVSLDLHPEEHYPYYMEMYPPDNNGNTQVPVPNMNNPVGN
jgi:hypothetical protein